LRGALPTGEQCKRHIVVIIVLKSGCLLFSLQLVCAQVAMSRAAVFVINTEVGGTRIKILDSTKHDVVSQPGRYHT
jgi:hypothetical protein